MNPIDFHISAEDEIRDASDYLDAQSGLGVDFEADVAATVARVRSNPLMYAADPRGYREAPLSRFSYIVAYIALPNRVWVAAVAHTARRPGYYARRRPGPPPAGPTPP